MEQRNPPENEWWSVWQAGARLMPEGKSPIPAQGLSGCLFRSRSAPLLYADVEALLLPGLRALGISATLVPLHTDFNKDVPENSTPGILRFASPQAGIPVFGLDTDPDLHVADLAEEAPPAQVRDYAASVRAQSIVRQAVLFREGSGGLRVQEAGEVTSLPLESFDADFVFGLNLQRAQARGTRRVNLIAALQRVVLFGLAFPERFLKTDADDADKRALAGKFLISCAGRQHDALSNRWRRAGQCLSAGDVEVAWEILYAAALQTLNLPDAVCTPLLCPTDMHLTDLERRELIYLARAGRSSAQVFAANRLQYERHQADARHTLEQLMRAHNPLVRAAAYFEE